MNSKSSSMLSGSDFTAPPVPKDQAIALIFGLPGSGKSTIGLAGAPDPTAFIDIDRRGLHAAQEAVRQGKRVFYTRVDYPSNLSKLDDNAAKMAAQKAWDKFMKNYEIAIRESQQGKVRTIVIDTMTELAEILNISKTGRVDRKKDDYGKTAGLVKAELTKAIKMSRDGEANLIMLARAKELWEDNKPTGRFTYRGPDTMEFDADWAGQIRLKKLKTVKAKKSQKHELEITKAGINLSILGDVYTEEDWGEFGPFVWACVMNYPGTSPEDWGYVER